MKVLAGVWLILLLLSLVAGSLTTDEDQAKIIVIILGMHKDTVEIESAEVQYGHPPNLGLQEGNFTATVRAENGTSLYTFSVWDTRYQAGDYGMRSVLELHEQAESPDLESAYDATGEPDIDLPLIIPYDNSIQTVELTEKGSGARLISINVSPAREIFRSRFPKDPDMLGLPPPGDHGVSFPVTIRALVAIITAVTAILILVLLAVLIRRP